MSETAPWRIQHLRLSLFALNPNFVSDSDTLFQELVGREPDVDEKRASGSLRRRVAEDEEARWELMEAPLRLDFTRLGAKNFDVAIIEGDIEKATLAKLEQLNLLLEACTPLFKRCEGIVRIAIGSLLFCPVSEPASAYNLLQERFPGLPLTYPGTSDFTIQMNRSRMSSVIEGLKINRLSNWNASTVAPLLNATSAITIGQGVHWLQAVLDVNTGAENTNILSDLLLSNLSAELSAQIPLLLANPSE